MSDNRDPVLAKPTGPTLTYPALAFALNALYSCAHGYDLLYYRMVAPDCRHAKQGTRHASYCKLPAIAHALEKYSTVVFIDSDSFVQRRNLSVPALLREYAPPPRASPANPAVWFANDLPQLGERPNGGFHVWLKDASGGAARLLRTWWHLPAGKYSVEHDYEQHALQWALSQLKQAVPLMGTLQLRAMHEDFTNLAVAHIDHTKAERRLWVMAIALLAAAHEQRDEGVASAPRRRQRLQQLLQSAAKVPPTLEPPAPLRKRALREAAELLKDGFGSPNRPSALFSEDGVRCPGVRRSGMPPGRLRAFSYNATEMALRTLPAHDVLGVDFLTVTLQKCGEKSTLQEWRSLEAGRWQLVAQPSFCLGVGPRKAPKTPYPMLAQLHSCEEAQPPPSLRALQHLHGRLETTATLKEMKTSLKEAARAAYRPVATAGRRLKQRRLIMAKKKKRKKKGKKEGGGGEASEEADAAAAGSKAQKSKKGGKKQKAAFWQDGAVKVDSEDAHLCLSTWRSQLVANAPVVFAPCVPTAAQQFATIDAAKGAKRLRLGTEDDNLCVGVGAF